jgi:hypothetical protein
MTKSVLPKDEGLPQIKIIPVNLPPPDTKRWVRQRKATIVNAVHSGAMSPEDVCRCYELSVEEFVTWQRTIETHGVAGLRVTRRQIYRGAPPARPAHHSESTIQTYGLLQSRLPNRCYGSSPARCYGSSPAHSSRQRLSDRSYSRRPRDHVRDEAIEVRPFGQTVMPQAP